MPSNVMPMMASWADSTIDASWEVAARTCLCSLMIERARNGVKERTFSWLLYIRIGHCRSFKNLKCQKRYSAKRKGLGYSPRDPHPVNHRVGAKCARGASKPFRFVPRHCKSDTFLEWSSRPC